MLLSLDKNASIYKKLNIGAMIMVNRNLNGTDIELIGRVVWSGQVKECNTQGVKINKT